VVPYHTSNISGAKYFHPLALRIFTNGRSNRPIEIRIFMNGRSNRPIEMRILVYWYHIPPLDSSKILSATGSRFPRPIHDSRDRFTISATNSRFSRPNVCFDRSERSALRQDLRCFPVERVCLAGESPKTRRQTYYNFNMCGERKNTQGRPPKKISFLSSSVVGFLFLCLPITKPTTQLLLESAGTTTGLQ
jgi:hypothetical protein